MSTYSNIFSQINTVAQKLELLQFIDELKDQKFEINNKDTQNVVIPQWMGQESNIQNLTGEELSSLADEINGLPIVEMSIQFEPSSIFIKKISDMLNQGSDIRKIIDFRVDASIIGGAIITSQGKFFDGSLRYVFEKNFDAFKPKLQMILEGKPA